MESSYQKKIAGQLIIELSLVLGLISLLLFCSLKVGMIIHQKFKHDFVSPLPRLPDFEIKFNDGIVFLKESSRKKRILQLENNGWEVDANIPIETGWLLMKRNNEKMLVTNKLGILL